MKFKFLFLALVLVACGPSQGQVETAIAQTQVVWTPVPTQTAYPTLTPQPTYTKAPTIAVQVTKIVNRLVTATLPPNFVELHRFTGTGKGTTDLFALPSGKAKIIWEYTGTSNFAFYIKRFDNDVELLIENTIGATTGQAIYEVGASDEYLFDINLARGDWTIMVEFRP